MKPPSSLKRAARDAFPEPVQPQKWMMGGIVHAEVTLPVLDGWLVKCRPEHDDAAVELLQQKAKAAGVHICILSSPI